ncbi:MAG: hypothetical protein ACM3TN_05155 [Alphaproteobacteria bacterium]
MTRHDDASARPGLLRRFWEAWKRFGKRIADMQARLLLSFFYFVLLAPFALALRRWGDPLGIKAGSAKGWHTRESGVGTLKERAARQF